MTEAIMTKHYSAVLRGYLRWFSQFIEGRSFLEAAEETYAAHNLENAKTHFKKEGFYGEDITSLLLEKAAIECGFHRTYFEPKRTFKDMLAVLEQHKQGLVTDGELLLALQMVPTQVRAVVEYNSLPYKVHAKCSLTDWDEQVASNFSNNL